MKERITIDRKALIHAIELRKRIAERNNQAFVDLPYEITGNMVKLLKEQEAVEPKKLKGYKPPMYTVYEYECESCESPLLCKQPFCSGCGKRVNWG